MGNNRFIHKALDSDGQQIPIIGIQISWSFGEREYNQQAVIDAHLRHDLPIEHLQKGQKRIVATKRALQKMKGDGNLKEIESDSDIMRFQFTEDFIDSLPSGSTFKNLRIREIVRYTSATDSFSFEDAEGKPYSNDPKAAQIHSLVQHCSSVFTTADITRYVQKLFEKSSIIRMRKDGGVYFVPAKHVALCEKVQRMFNDIDTRGYFSMIEIPDTQNVHKSVAVSFENDIESKIAELREKWNARKEENKDMSRTVFSNDMKEIAEMAGNLEIYSDILKNQFDDAKELIEEVTTELKKQIGII